MVRNTVDALADMRALNIEHNRQNPLSGRRKLNRTQFPASTSSQPYPSVVGSGATPSMGLSQFRGGKRMGKQLRSHLLKNKSEKYLRSMMRGMGASDTESDSSSDEDVCGGMGTGKYEGMGKKPTAAQLRKLGKNELAVHSEAHSLLGEGHKLNKSIQAVVAKHMKGGSKVTVRDAVAKHMPFAQSSAAERDRRLKAFYKEVGKDSSLLRHLRALLKESEDDDTKDILREHIKDAQDRGYDLLVSSDSGGAIGAGALGSDPSMTMIGSGKMDGRKARAEVVRKVMRDKKLSMIEASKYVKAHNLYKK